MADVSKLDQEDRRGQEAERLMNEPLLKEAFKLTEDGLISALKQAKMADRDTQHEIAISLQLLERIQKILRTTIETGKMARIQKQTLAERLLKRVR